MNTKALCLAGILLSLAASTVQAQPNGPVPQPVFPSDNWWNVNISAAPVDPRSADFLDFIGRSTELHPDFGGFAESPPATYGIHYVSVPGSQPLVPVTFVEYGDESDAGAPGRPAGYPIPIEARSQPGYIEGGYPGSVDANGDRHLLLVDRDNRLLYELYHTFWNSEANRWEAGSGAVFDLKTNGRRPEGWTSADAAGLAIFPGLVRYDEAVGSDPIDHAFRFTIRATNGHVFPASHSAGGTTGSLPMGARLRLKASKNISGFTPEVRRIFQAMKTYGLILADNGSDMYISGAHDVRWDNDVLNPAFASLTADDFEVIQLGWKPAASTTCTPADTRLCLNGSRFQVEVEWTLANGTNGAGHAVSMTPDTGYFWFFNSANVEAVIKVLDGCGVNNRYWVFAGGLTDVRAQITVTDLQKGVSKVYTNPQGTAFRPIQDTGAFATCP